ncbi:MAG: SEC-C metal-binding domain-containing protein [Kofleriaceae bacterium]
MSHVVTTDHVEKTIAAFTRLDQKGDKKAMNKLAQRLQKEQPFLLQHAAAVRTEHGDAVGEAAVFYATLIWAMFDRGGDGTLPRLTQQNLNDADQVVTTALAKIEGLADKAPEERVAPELVETQPHIYAKLAELLAEDVKEAAMTAETATTIIKPTEVVIEAFDAAVSGRRAGQQQGTIVAADKVGRNEPCPCGSGKKYKKCHGVEA